MSDTAMVDNVLDRLEQRARDVARLQRRLGRKAWHLNQMRETLSNRETDLMATRKQVRDLEAEVVRIKAEKEEYRYLDDHPDRVRERIRKLMDEVKELRYQVEHRERRIEALIVERDEERHRRQVARGKVAGLTAERDAALEAVPTTFTTPPDLPKLDFEKGFEAVDAQAPAVAFFSDPDEAPLEPSKDYPIERGDG